MTILIFILLMAIFCFTDIKYFIIPNWIVLPAIILGCMLTGNWLFMSGMFIVGAIMFERKLLAGGDVKLITMSGAFLGIYGLSILILAGILVWAYRIYKQDKGPLPYAPFVGLASIPFLFL